MFYLDSSMQEHNNYFAGIAISEKEIILSLSGLRQYYIDHKNLLSLVGGRYSLVYADTLLKSTVIMTDLSGQDTLFYYKKGSFWAVSNSLYLLVEELTMKGVKLDVYKPALYGYKIKHSLGFQPISNNTFIKDVKILERDNYIEILNGRFIIQSRDAEKINISNDADYIYFLGKVLSEQGSIANNIIASLDKGAVRCDLTGGFDSRFVFSLVKKAGLLNKVRVSSNLKKENDYLLASYIAGLNNISIDNSPISSKSLLTESSKIFDLYKYGNSGVYSGGIYKVSYDSIPSTLHLHGAGGEALRGQYVGTPRQVIGRLEGHFTQGSTEFFDVKNEFLNYFRIKDLDINDPRSMIEHARNFMSRFHFGRNWYRSLTNPLFSPMCDIRLEALSDYLISKNNNPKSIFYDTYLLLDQDLACLPFDIDGKNMNFSDLKGFLERKSTHEIDLSMHKEYIIYGQLGEDGDIVNIGKNNTNLDSLSFDGIASLEREVFMQAIDKEYHQFSHNVSVYTLLNLLK